MNNFETMKSNAISFVDKMDIEQFYHFASVIADFSGQNIPGMLTCEMCKERYGDCENEHNEDEQTCLKRFAKYANSKER